MATSIKEIPRVKRPRQAARRAYNRMSPIYDLVAGTFERSFTRKALSLLDVQPGEQVLEIGFGTGDALVSIARAAGQSGKAFGIDIADRMLDKAHSNIIRRNLSDRVELRCGDALQLPYRSSMFDAVFMSFVLELFDTEDIDPLLGECRRVLRTDGRLCVVSLSSRLGIRGLSKLYLWLHNLVPTLFDCRPIPVGRLTERAGFMVVSESGENEMGFNIDTILARVDNHRRGRK